MPTSRGPSRLTYRSRFRTQSTSQNGNPRHRSARRSRSRSACRRRCRKIKAMLQEQSRGFFLSVQKWWNKFYSTYRSRQSAPMLDDKTVTASFVAAALNAVVEIGRVDAAHPVARFTRARVLQRCQVERLQRTASQRIASWSASGSPGWVRATRAASTSISRICRARQSRVMISSCMSRRSVRSASN